MVVLFGVNEINDNGQELMRVFVLPRMAIMMSGKVTMMNSSG